MEQREIVCFLLQFCLFQVEARAGIGYCISQLLFDTPVRVKEDSLSPLVSVILGLVLNVDDVLQLRAVASHVLRHGIGKTMGATGRRKLYGLLLKR